MLSFISIFSLSSLLFLPPTKKSYPFLPCPTCGHTRTKTKIDSTGNVRKNPRTNRDDDSDDDDDDDLESAAVATVDESTKIDCEVTEWKRTPCNVTCGDGHRFKSRAIIVSPKLLS